MRSRRARGQAIVEYAVLFIVISIAILASWVIFSRPAGSNQTSITGNARNIFTGYFNKALNAIGVQ